MMIMMINRQEKFGGLQMSELQAASPTEVRRETTEAVS